MIYWVYVMRSSKDGALYVGSTHDVAHRLDKHNAGLVPGTKDGRPWKGIHQEEHPTRTSAIRREEFLRTGRGRDFLKRLKRKANEAA